MSADDVQARPGHRRDARVRAFARRLRTDVADLYGSCADAIRNWAIFVRGLGLLTVLGAIAMLGYLVHLQPLPPSRAYLGAGQPGTSQHALAMRFADYFERHGVKLDVVTTGGSDQNLSRLRDDASAVNASMVLGGTVPSDRSPDLVSLGSVRYSPVWLFYRREAFSADERRTLAQMPGKRVAVGGDGTATRSLLEQMLALNGTTLAKGGFVPMALPHEEAADRLLAGTLDAMFLVDGIDSPIVRRLLAAPGVGRHEFEFADAYTAQLPFLDTVVLRKAALDLGRVDPPRDVTMLASSVTLLVERDTHPVVQWLFLMAASEFGADRGQVIARPGTFPAYLDQSVPLSPVAKRYFQSGPPAMLSWLPLWLCVLLERAWVEVLALAAVVMPLLQRLRNLGRLPAQVGLDEALARIRALELRAAQTDDPAELRAIVAGLAATERRIESLRFDGDALGTFYKCRATCRDVRRELEARLATTHGAAMEAPDAADSTS
jgi:hypothetical protein